MCGYQITVQPLNILARGANIRVTHKHLDTDQIHAVLERQRAKVSAVKHAGQPGKPTDLDRRASNADRP